MIIPYTREAIIAATNNAKNTEKLKSIFLVGGINYSVSSERNTYDGQYVWQNQKDSKKTFRASETAEYENSVKRANDLRDVLRKYDFAFEEYGDSNTQKTKIPCIIAANLISPKLAYKSEGKSDVDMTPFISSRNSNVIPQAVERAARKIKTFKKANIVTQDLLDARRNARREQELRELKRQRQEEEKLRRQEERDQKREEREQEEEQKRKEKEEKKEIQKCLSDCRGDFSRACQRISCQQ